MTIFADWWRRAGVTGLLLGCALVPMAAQTPEDAARLRLESGREFLKKKDYVEALKDFQVVLQTYRASSVADDAQLEIARYQLEVARDLRAADAAADLLLKEYSESDSAPMALVVKGRAAMEAGRSDEQINTAIASFDRVSRLYGSTEAVPQAMYYAGETARLAGRRAEAIERFTTLATQYPASVCAPNSLRTASPKST